jgi:spore germination protein KB
MEMKVQITSGMFVALIINLVYAKAIGVSQGMIAREVGHDMWIATLLAIVQGAAMMYIGYVIVSKAPSLNFPDTAAALLGHWFGRAVAIVLLLFFLLAFGAVMITYVYHLRDYFLPEHPLALFIAAALVVGAAGAYYGIEVMARMAFVGLFFVFLLNIMLSAGSLGNFDIRNLQPVLENGMPKVLLASRHHDVDWAMATMMAAVIMPTVASKGGRAIGRAGLLGILIGGLLIMQWPILEAGVLSGEVTSQYIVSCMKLARSAHIGQFLHRYEMLMIAFFAVSCLIQVMACVYCSALMAHRIIGKRGGNYRRMVLPMCAVLGGFGYWVVEDHLRALHLLNLWPWAALPVAFGLPALLLALRWLLPHKLKGAPKPHSQL